MSVVGKVQASIFQCMGEGTLASVYDLHLEEGITKDQFVQLCPALVQQQLSGSCEPVESTTPVVELEEPVTLSQSRWCLSCFALFST